jgi:hypothetical protein
MRCIHRFLLVAAVILLGATPLAAQTVPTVPATPDSTKVTTLETVTVTASGNWFTRADDLRRSVIAAMAENRRLAGVLRDQDAQVVRLTVRLDSLKRVEFVQKVRIATLDDSVTATRARRRALEARLLVVEAKQPER